MAAEIKPFEMMIGALSKLLNDGEMAACGTLSPIPASAILQAKHTHAPNLTPFIYGDLSLRLTEGHLETFAAFQRGKVDVFFLSGVQESSRNDDLRLTGRRSQHARHDR